MQRIMIDNRNIILCYGNPAGYLSGNEAMVDTMFQTEELSAFLKKQNIDAVWSDGIYDRLMTAGAKSFDPEAPPLKSCRLWQLKYDTPVSMRFIAYDVLTKKYGEPELSNYVPVYDSAVDTNDLEELYSMFRGEVSGYDGRQIAISDIIELYDTAGSEYYYCDRMDFRQLDFDQPQQTMEQTM